MLIRPYKVADVRDYFIGAKHGGGYGQTVDKTGVKCIELIGASFLANEPAIFGTPNIEYIKKEIEWYEFGKMLSSYEGFNFKLEIFDKTEEK